MDTMLMNAWYVCASSEEVPPQAPLGRFVCNEPIVVYRKADGSVAALEDRCCHRRYPLSKGAVEGDNLRCGYHGFMFDHAGTCVEIPGQRNIPREARVQTYPVVERDGWIWIWMGDPQLADPTDIPEYYWFSDPDWRGKRTYFHVKANYRLIIQNLLDLSHLAFVHSSTIGNRATVDKADVTFDLKESEVRVTRWMVDVPPPPTLRALGGFNVNVDRWQVIHFTPPGSIRLYTGAKATGTGAPEGHFTGGLELSNLHAITPETDKTSHYFWGACHKGMLDRPEVTENLFQGVLTAFLEDQEIFEVQQKLIDHDPSKPEVYARADAGALQAMRILDRLAAEQQGGGRPIIKAANITLGPWPGDNINTRAAT